MKFPPARFTFLLLLWAARAAAAPATFSATDFFPASGATGVCPDTLLRLTFNAPARLGPRGKIAVFDADTHALVTAIDVSAPVPTKTIGGMSNFHYYPVIMAAREATIDLGSHTLSYGKRYDVTVDPGVFQDPAGGASAAIGGPARWRFSTRSIGPATGATNLTVAADGTGDFCTVQGALDFIPDGNTAPTTVFIRRGTYPEMIFFTDKHGLTLRGEDRRQTVIAYPNNAKFNSSSGSDHIHGGAYHRGVLLARHSNDLVITNLTIRNTTPRGGSQAEALILSGSTSARAIVTGVDLFSYQDTLQINGQAYVSQCTIEGDVDFMWGTGPCFFEECECRSLRSAAYYTQIRNPATNHGYVYLHCTFDGTPGVMGNFLSRIAPGAFPHSEVVLLECTLGKSVGGTAWLLQGGGSAAGVHFWEFQSREANGAPVEVSERLAGSRQLRQPEDAALIAQYREPTFVLGGGWNPKKAPIFASPPPAPPKAPDVRAAESAPILVAPPSGQLALPGMTAYFDVVATGAALRYQWSKNGRPLPGANSSFLQIADAQWEDAGNYAVTVANSAGATTSEVAELTIVAPQAAPAPRLPSIPLKTFPVTAFGAVADGRTDDTAAIQKAIDSAHAAGGGWVVLPAAAQAYLSGPLVLASGIDLQIDRGATLRALPYSPAELSPAGSYPLGDEVYPTFLAANDAHDVAISGGGTIDGQGAPWWAAFRADHSMPHRPFLVKFSHCTAVLIEGVTLTNSPMFHAAMGAIDHLTVFDLTVRCNPVSPNTDGVDPSGSHQLIQNCVISCGDDNIAVKAGGAFCTDLTVADCAFGEGHGVSVGGQSNRGLDGLTVKNCTFTGTTSGLRLKADATQGGPVQNVSYANLEMAHVAFPFLFYSYYNRVGNPGSISGGNQTTVAKVRAWNAAPPNSLDRKTLPSWRGISLSHLTATGATGYSVIWGLPLSGYFVDRVKLDNVRIRGGAGLEIFDATDVQFGGHTEVGALLSCNALAITLQPQSLTAPAGGRAVLTIEVVGGSGVQGTAPTYQWKFNGKPLADGKTADGATVSGAGTPTLTIEGFQPGEAGAYVAAVSAALDIFDPATKTLAPGHLPVTVLSSSAELTVAPRS